MIPTFPHPGAGKSEHKQHIHGFSPGKANETLDQLSTMVDTWSVEIIQTGQFKDWLRTLKDRAGKARISILLDRWDRNGAVTGDIKSVGHGVYEARVHSGPGYRLYFAQRQDVVIVLLVGGDKGSQPSDIETASDLLAQLKEQGEW